MTILGLRTTARGVVAPSGEVVGWEQLEGLVSVLWPPLPLAHGPTPGFLVSMAASRSDDHAALIDFVKQASHRLLV